MKISFIVSISQIPPVISLWCLSINLRLIPSHAQRYFMLLLVLLLWSDINSRLESSGEKHWAIQEPKICSLRLCGAFGMTPSCSRLIYRELFLRGILILINCKNATVECEKHQSDHGQSVFIPAFFGALSCSCGCQRFSLPSATKLSFAYATADLNLSWMTHGCVVLFSKPPGLLLKGKLWVCIQAGPGNWEMLTTSTSLGEEFRVS